MTRHSTRMKDQMQTSMQNLMPLLCEQLLFEWWSLNKSTWVYEDKVGVSIILNYVFAIRVTPLKHCVFIENWLFWKAGRRHLSILHWATRSLLHVWVQQAWTCRLEINSLDFRNWKVGRYTVPTSWEILYPEELTFKLKVSGSSQNPNDI